MRRQNWRKICGQRGHVGFRILGKAGGAAMIITKVFGATVICSRCRRAPVYQGHPVLADYNLIQVAITKQEPKA